VSVTDVLTVAVLAFVGVRIASGTRFALTGAGRGRVGIIVRGLRVQHFIPPIPVLCLVVVAVIALLQVPFLDFGWWSALGGVGNPVTGNTDRTAGTALEWLIPLCFIVLLLPALPLFAEAEERMFRLGSEVRSQWQRFVKGIQFGLMHALIGIPIGAALALSIGGWYFTWWYLRAYRRTGSSIGAMLESTRAHLAYNLTVVVIILALVLLIPA
jgi:hypothetical protein